MRKVHEVLRLVKDDKKAAEDSGASKSTLRNWRSQKTRRAFCTTLQAVALANGKRWRLVDN